MLDPDDNTSICRYFKDIDNIINYLTKSLAKLHDVVRLQVEPKILLLKIKREKLRALMAVARSQFISAEMEVLLATNKLRLELGALVEEWRNKIKGFSPEPAISKQIELLEAELEKDLQSKQEMEKDSNNPKEEDLIITKSERNRKRPYSEDIEDLEKDDDTQKTSNLSEAKRARARSPDPDQPEMSARETNSEHENVKLDIGATTRSPNADQAQSESDHNNVRPDIGADSASAVSSYNSGSKSATSKKNLIVKKNTKSINKKPKSLTERDAETSAVIHEQKSKTQSEIIEKHNVIEDREDQNKEIANNNSDVQYETENNNFEINDENNTMTLAQDTNIPNNQVIVSLKTHRLPVPCLEKFNLKKVSIISNIRLNKKNETLTLKRDDRYDGKTVVNKRNEVDIQQKVLTNQVTTNTPAKQFKNEKEGEVIDINAQENENNRSSNKENKVILPKGDCERKDFVTEALHRLHGVESRSHKSSHSSDSRKSHSDSNSRKSSSTYRRDPSGSPCTRNLDSRRDKHRLSLSGERRSSVDSKKDQDRIKSPPQTIKSSYPRVRSSVSSVRAPIPTIRSPDSCGRYSISSVREPIPTIRSPDSCGKYSISSVRAPIPTIRSPDPLFSSPKSSTRRTYVNDKSESDIKQEQEMNILYKEVMNNKQNKIENDNCSISSAKTLLLATKK